MTAKVLSEKAAAWFEKRGISAETVTRYSVYTASRDQDEGVRPDPQGNIIAFPYIDHGRDVAEKYRTHPKTFWQRLGGKKTFWNADVLDDTALHDGRNSLVITEGEIDALTVIDCGYPFAVSVPDGAPAVPDGKRPDELETIDPQAEQSGKFEYMWNNRDRLKKIKRFIIASDSDAPGQRLAAELVRRLSAAKCSFVTYPSDCKDLNEVRLKHGAAKVMDIISNAQPYPVRGIYKLSDYPSAPDLHTFGTGFDGLSLKVFIPEFMVVTGIPGHGKTAWTVDLTCNLAQMYGWRCAMFSPEMRTVPIMRDKLRRRFIGSKPVLGDPKNIARADSWIQRHFTFIDADPTGTGDADEPFDLDWVIERATDAVLRDGIRLLIIDPWNEIEHAKRRDETMAEYIGRSIRALKRFAAMYGVMVIVVAHPTKEVGKDGKHRLVTLYDIDGAAHWFNKCDHGVVVERKNNQTIVHVQKVKHEPETGQRNTDCNLRYDQSAGRFFAENPEPEYGDAA